MANSIQRAQSARYFSKNVGDTVLNRRDITTIIVRNKVHTYAYTESFLKEHKQLWKYHLLTSL